MNLQEYQAKSLLAGAGVAVPRGRIARSRPDAAAPASSKARGRQGPGAPAPAGGRGGVNAAPLAEAAAAAAAMIGRHLITIQSGPKGDPSRRCSSRSSVDRPRGSSGLTIDRSLGCETVIASARRHGGREIAARDRGDPAETITPAAGI
jgi:succinyl-CoA synthetase beta subunit